MDFTRNYFLVFEILIESVTYNNHYEIWTEDKPWYVMNDSVIRINKYSCFQNPSWYFFAISNPANDQIVTKDLNNKDVLDIFDNVLLNFG